MLGTVAAAVMHMSHPITRPWESEVVYQIFPRSFRDSNGDRIGDFKGIEQGLDSIVKLGATTILLNPVWKSRTYHNYFSDDWFAVDPEFGTTDDFRELCRVAHEKGIRIVLDMEPQYVADGHPWYKAAVQHPQGKEAEYFFDKLSDNPFGTSPWYDKAKISLKPVRLSHPDVRQAIQDNFAFWRSLGVDGFRIDHMMDDLDWQGKNKDLYANLWKPVIEDMKKKSAETWFIGEQAEWESFRACLEIFLKTPTDAVFNFRFYGALVALKRPPIEKALNEYNYFTPNGRMQANFLENHDLARYASTEPNPARQRAAAAILFGAKGIPAVYAGQELGMKGMQGHWNSDGNDIPIRLAYRWGATKNVPGTATWYAGTGPWDSDRFSSDHDGVSYAEQDPLPESLLNYYRQLIRARKGSPALSMGTQKVTDVGEDFVLAFERQHEKDRVLVLSNLSDQPAVLHGQAGQDLITGKRFDGRLKPYQTVYLRQAP